jgi:hypothetical protein
MYTAQLRHPAIGSDGNAFVDGTLDFRQYVVAVLLLGSMEHCSLHFLKPNTHALAFLPAPASVTGRTVWSRQHPPHPDQLQLHTRAVPPPPHRSEEQTGQRRQAG